MVLPLSDGNGYGNGRDGNHPPSTVDVDVPVKPRAIFEYQTQHFGFSPKAFTDTVHNVMLDEWMKVVDTVIMPRLPLENLNDEMRERLRLRLVSDLMRKGRLVRLLEAMETYMQQYVFRIPDTVTLPEDRCQLVAPVEHAQKLFDETLERVEMQEKRMLQLRASIEMHRIERENVKAAIAVIRGIAEMAGLSPTIDAPATRSNRSESVESAPTTNNDEDDRGMDTT